MTNPDETPTEIDRDAVQPTGEPAPLQGGTDVSVDPDDLDGPVERSATTDPDQMTDDEALGGVGGGSPGGAG